MYVCMYVCMRWASGNKYIVTGVDQAGGGGGGGGGLGC